MRPLHWATLDKRRPVLLLTREIMVGRMSTVTVAPVTSTIHGIATEVLVGTQNGLDQASGDQVRSVNEHPFPAAPRPLRLAVRGTGTSPA